jgi:hypothetical protein
MRLSAGFLGVRLSEAEAGFDLANPLIEVALDLIDSVTRAQVAGLIEMLEIGAQFQQELLERSVAHRRLISHMNACECKITRIWRGSQQVEAVEGVG